MKSSFGMLNSFSSIPNSTPINGSSTHSSASSGKFIDVSSNPDSIFLKNLLTLVRNFYKK
nr:hypothetical protein [Apibacter adventoris]